MTINQTQGAPKSAPLDLSESAAGEEDPGASIDIGPAPMSPGEDICPSCGGSGVSGGRECPACKGTGKVSVGIDGA